MSTGKNQALPQLGYRYTRPRGFAPWRPQQKTHLLLDKVKAILAEYEQHLPMTCRQIFYRLVGAHGYEKTEAAYDRLQDTLNRARRAGLVSFGAIRDDGIVESAPGGFHGLPHFWRVVSATADDYRRDRMADQGAVVEVWVEAGGMVPQVAAVAHEVGASVYSSGGFESLTMKHDAAQRFLARSRGTVVLHIGDHDPSGVSVFHAVSEDVLAFVSKGVGAEYSRPVMRRAEFRRIAVTPEQIKRYRLPGAPPKATDKRGKWRGGTVQAEALAPDELAAEVRAALMAVIDPVVLASTLAAEKAERDELRARLDEIEETEEPH